MRMHRVHACMREAMGLTQTDVANLAGVSPSTIGNYENGKEVSTLVERAIRWAIDGELRKLEKARYIEVKLISQALQLMEENDAEKIETLKYILLNASKLQLELSKSEEP